MNFGTTEAKLKKAFQSIGPIRKVSIVKRKKNGEELSCGYGFIEFGSPEGASEALKGLQGIQVDGHFLQIRVAKGKDDLPDEKQSVSKRRSDAPLDRICKTKIIVKNLPFEANIKELKSLFGTFGQIKSCRLPKKFNGQHRGFAFMEFVSEQEAENAFKTLTNTHFYGRHLVLQWAKQDESVEEIREKTKRSFESSSDALNFSTDTKRPKISP